MKKAFWGEISNILVGRWRREMKSFFRLNKYFPLEEKKKAFRRWGWQKVKAKIGHIHNFSLTHDFLP